jgi:UDP-N-acetylglucosamine 2-epimerase (non-hydrolysing)
VLVVGDVNSTLAAALVAAKLQIPVVHLEAGLRSHDRSMPEEINRLVTDAVANLLLTPSHDAGENLLNEGKPPESIVMVGNIMIDALYHILSAQTPGERAHIIDRYTGGRPYVLITLHRPSNVDNVASLESILETLAGLDSSVELVFPVHPRTRSHFAGITRWAALKGRFRLLEPLRYRDFVALEKHASLVVTDSGGVQEETTALGVPCITVRDTTERPVTVTVGTNVLVGHDREALIRYATEATAGRWKKGSIPVLWDGRTASRVLPLLDRYFT